MKKYEIYYNTIELPHKKADLIKPGVTIDAATDIYPEKISSHDTLEEAKEMLKVYCTTIQNFSSNHHYFIEEYYVEENEYDDDGDWVECGGIWEFTQPEIELINNDTGEILGIYNNYVDARKAYMAYDGEDDLYIKL